MNEEKKFNTSQVLSQYNRIIKDLGKVKETPYRRFDFAIEVHQIGDVTYDDVVRAQKAGTPREMRRISRYFYSTNASYRRMIDHFAATYLYYYNLDLRGAAERGQKGDITKLYTNSLAALDGIDIENTFENISKNVLIDGVFFGYVNEYDNFHTTITSLNPNYCRNRNKSAYNTYVVEFNLKYLEQYVGTEDFDQVFAAMPSEVQIGWNLLKSGELASPWVSLAPEKSCAFFFSDDLCPPLFSDIIDILNFDEYKDIEKKRDTQELEKLLVQRLPFDEDHDPEVFLEELAVLHKAVSDMMQDRDSIDVLTSIADDVSMLETRSNANAAKDNIKKMLLPKYEGAGLSSEIFSATGASSLEKNIQNTTSFMSQLVNQYSTWLSMWLYSKFRYEKIVPIVKILPITHYNQEKMRDSYLKEAQYGFSWMLPQIAQGKKQSTLIDTIYIEQDVLNLKDKMRPLSSSFTESDGQMKPNSGKIGRPELPDDEKSVKTIANINANQ